jgi:peptidoglycan/xylan/chitin deacetylase (PgdA/CDA1 family)
MLDERLVRAGCSALSLLRAERFLEARLRILDAAVVLNLHQVTPTPNPFWPGLHPNLLDELVQYAARRFEVVTISELARLPQSCKRKRPRLAFSFDDGYQDFLEHAVPILDRHGVRVNQNVITGCVASGLPPWNVLMYDFLLAAPPTLLRELRIPGFHRSVPRSLPERASYGVALSAYLKRRPRAEREPLLQSLRDAMDRVDFPRTRMMSVAEVKSIAARHEIGSHSHSHESMALESDGFFREDFAASRSFFERTLDLPLTIYAFPNGSSRPEQVRHLLNEGLQYVLLVGEQLVRPVSSRVVPRITFYARSAPEARLRCVGWSPWGLARPQTPSEEQK